MMKRCTNCTHPPHLSRPCEVVIVSGPPVDNDGERLSRADQHPGRTLTRCDCTTYAGGCPECAWALGNSADCSCTQR